MKSRIVLSQYRDGSQYSDEIGVRYHFPRKYYNLLTLPDIEFIYYEPKKQGQGVYFGYGEVGKVDPDPQNPDQYFAELSSYRPFDTPVPGVDQEGMTREAPPYYNPQNAVRQIVSEKFEDICKEGALS